MPLGEMPRPKCSNGKMPQVEMPWPKRSNGKMPPGEMPRPKWSNGEDKSKDRSSWLWVEMTEKRPSWMVEQRSGMPAKKSSEKETGHW
jgi:hypothetical protein